jgi:high-affinity iron transporter
VLALAGVAFVGVGREGVETALFLFAATKESGALTTIAGGLIGVVAAVGLGVLFYRGAIKIDLRKFFTVTGMLVIVLAAFLLFAGLHELGEAGGGEALEIGAPLAGLLYGAGFAWLFLRGLRAEPARA